ncbi:phage tail tube protein [Cellulomonas sp. HZM]|uniref:phage tail tube protein n=1 Tax=Cellulomonas sp. HZM TaxID=1454010 RepID=UPI000492EFDE|nr:phage tail tube protein [Cellulomonas sp. HZM]
MAIASGLGAHVGIAPEVTYGAYVAPTSFVQPNKASLKKTKNTEQSAAIASGRLQAAAAGRQPTTVGGSGSLELDVANRKMGLLVQALMGTSVTPTVLTAPAYQQTHVLADTFGKSLSIQVGLPDASGVVRPYSYTGCKVTSATFEIDLAKILAATFEFDAQDVSEAQALAAPSYPAAVSPFVGTQASVKVGVFGAEAAVAGVTKATVKIDRNLNTDRYYLGGGGKKAEPIANAPVGISGTVSADFVDKTVFADRFVSDAGFSLVIEARGALLAAPDTYDLFRITLPGCYLDGDTPVLDGPDQVSGDFPFTCLFDGANTPKIEIVSADSILA